VLAGLVGLAARYRVDLLGGSHCRIADDGSLRNTAYLVRPDGEVLGQDKLHLTPQEHALGMRGGDALLVARVGPFTAGVLVCADLEFPELARTLTARGVDLLLAPSLTRMTVAAQARAMENQLYVLLSPLVGSSGLPADTPLHATGRALVTGPIDRTVGANDGVLAAADGPGESVLLVDLDPALLARSRAAPEVPGLALRRPDLYLLDPSHPVARDAD
jgi:predicted amidohydrolase